jgi:glyoxylase-like metal-dependent hydrolase (beta-lactamase superfamily II)
MKGWGIQSSGMRSSGTLLVLITLCVVGHASPAAKQIGPGLYAYISDNDGSANSTFLVGKEVILVVDTGVDAKEGGKLLAAIRSVSNLPVKYIVNTHYHPDHQGGNSVVGPDAVVISTDWTRDHTISMSRAQPAANSSRFRPARLTFTEALTLHIDPYLAKVYFPGKAHTSGDAMVYFPEQHSIATGDLFLTRSSPAMDEGSVKSWIHALDQVLDLPVDSIVPGHFELAGKPELQRFRDYLSDLYVQVQNMHDKGASVEAVRRNVHMEKYSDFRQYPNYEATFADNAETIYHQLQQQ